MMVISFRCPGCGAPISARDEMSGKQAKCKCGKKLRVPATPSQSEAGQSAGDSAFAEWFDEELKQPLPDAKGSTDRDPLGESKPAVPREADAVQALADRAAEAAERKEREFRRERADFASQIVFRMVVLWLGPSLVLGVGALVGYYLSEWAVLRLCFLVVGVVSSPVFFFLWIRLAVGAFFESVFHGLAFVFVPFYWLYYLASRWDEGEGNEVFLFTWLLACFVIGGFTGGIFGDVAIVTEAADYEPVASSVDDGPAMPPDDAGSSPQPDTGGAAEAPKTAPEPEPSGTQLEPEVSLSLELTSAGGGGRLAADQRGLIVTGQTNLPAGSLLKMEVESALPGVVSGATIASVGPDGSFSSGPIPSQLEVGRFSVDLWVDLADQSFPVLAIIGKQGEKLRGDLVQVGRQEVVRLEATLDLGGKHAADRQLRDAAEAVRRCDLALRQIDKALRRIQDARPRLRTSRQREGFQSQVLSQREEIEKELAGLPEWSPKGLLLEAAGGLQVGSESTAAAADARVREMLKEAESKLKPLRVLAGEAAGAPPQVADPTPRNDPAMDAREEAAAAKLRLGKMLIGANASAAKRRLEEVIEQFPRTKAAESARESLEELEKE